MKLLKSKGRDSGAPRPFQSEEPREAWIEYREHLVATSGEFMGTVLFLFFSFGGSQVARMSTQGGSMDLQEVIYISLSFGFSLMTTSWAFYRISGGLFNLAVCISLLDSAQRLLIRRADHLSTVRQWEPYLDERIFFFPAQILGGIVAAALASCMFPGPLPVQTTLSQHTSTAQGVFIEMFLTAELVFTVLMLAAEKSTATFIALLGIGLALFVAELTGQYHK